MVSFEILKCFIVNIFLTFIKLVFGFTANCKTLIADGIQCLSDTLTDIIAFIGAKFSNKKPNKKHPYGYGKIEYLTSIFISLFILYLGVSILVNCNRVRLLWGLPR